MAKIVITSGTPALTAYFAGGSYEVNANSSGTIISKNKYYSLGGATVMDANGTLQYFLTDQQGSTVAVLNESSVSIGNQRYMPFGAVRPDLGGTSGQTDFGYTGQREMGSIGLMDYNARFYDQSIGDFIQPDSMVSNPVDPQTWNRYSYVENNPINLTDPTGHCVVGGHDMPDTNPACQQNPNPNPDPNPQPSGGDNCAGLTGAAHDACEGNSGDGGNTHCAHTKGLNRNDELGNCLNHDIDQIAQGLLLAFTPEITGIQALVSGFSAQQYVTEQSTEEETVAIIDSEYKALRLQGFTDSEAIDLAKQFNSGINPGNQFGFHFTTAASAEKIISSEEIFASKSGLGGPGVYLGKLPMPGILRVIPVIGYGLEPSRSTRIPIFLSDVIQAGLRYTRMPNTLLFGNGQSLFLNP